MAPQHGEVLSTSCKFAALADVQMWRQMERERKGLIGMSEFKVVFNSLD